MGRFLVVSLISGIFLILFMRFFFIIFVWGGWLCGVFRFLLVSVCILCFCLI